MSFAACGRCISRGVLPLVHAGKSLRVHPRRHLFPKLPSLFSNEGGESMKYAERRVLGFSMEQMYEVVADVECYDQFVPWCVRSTVRDRHDRQLNCTLTVGFPPLDETYTSIVTLERPHYVKSESKSRLFSHLLSTWKFSPAPNDEENSCTLEFSVAFKFRSSLYSRVSHLFFNEVVLKMVEAFLARAERIHGPPARRHSRKQVLHHGPVE